MALELEYMIDPDFEAWIPVPLQFPWNGIASAEHWAADLATSLLEGTGAPIEVRTQLANTALAYARTSGPLPGALERFWHLPAAGGPECLVHLYAAEYPETLDADLSDLATAGIGGFVQRLEPLRETAFDFAARAVVIDHLADGTLLFTERLMGRSHGRVFVIELVEQDATVLGLMEQPLDVLFRSIQLRPRSNATS